MRTTNLSTTDAPASTSVSARILTITVWVLQVLLAVAFFLHGRLMVDPPAEMLPMMNAQIAPWFRMFIGVAELLAVVGLILPSITRILPGLTVAAAVGLMIVMASATVVHIVRGELSSAISAAVLFALVTTFAYLRWKVRPITPRTRA